MSEVRTVEVAPEDGEIRLDRWFKRHFPGISHIRLEKLLRTGQIRLDGKRARAGDRVAAGQVVRVPPLAPSDATPDPLPPAATSPKPPRARDIEAVLGAVIYRDGDVIALDKPAGLAVQGGTNTERHLDMLLDALRFDAKERPRLVHRLDKDTSGVLLLARNAAAAAKLTAAFREKTTRKVYWAVTVGMPKPRQGRIDIPLGKAGGAGRERVVPDAPDAKRAVTYYTTLEHAGGKAAFVALWPVTGRTHQLRAHCAAIGTPILGDGKYGGAGAHLDGTAPGGRHRLHLHARSIEIPHPQGGGRMLRVSAPLPPALKATWRFFGFDAEPEDDPFAELAEVRG